MNKYVIVNENENTYSVLKANDANKKFGNIKFHNLKDLVHGEFGICYITPYIWAYNIFTNSKFIKFKKELNGRNYIFKM